MISLPIHNPFTLHPSAHLYLPIHPSITSFITTKSAAKTIQNVWSKRAKLVLVGVASLPEFHHVVLF
jgi:hypothetical protein